MSGDAASQSSRGAGGHPDLQRAREPAAHRRAGCAPPCPTRDVLVADDNSPDGTGEIADELAAADDPACTCCTGRARRPRRGLHRRLRAGRSTRATTSLVEMDADGSHQPEQLPRLLDRAATAPTWCSARAGCPAARCVNWPLHREVLSRGGNLYARLAARHPARRRDRRLPRLPRERARDARPGRRRSRRATASRSTWPGAPCGPATGRRGADHVRRARASATQQDEPRIVARGAAAGDQLGRARTAGPVCGGPGRGRRP